MFKVELKNFFELKKAEDFINGCLKKEKVAKVKVIPLVLDKTSDRKVMYLVQVEYA